MRLIKKIFNLYKDSVNKNFLILFLFMISIGFIRNSLELMFYWKTKRMYGFSLSVVGVLNTIIYVFLMIIAEGYLLNLFLGGGRDKLRELVHKGACLLLGLFVLIPILNNIFNYYLFNLPMVFIPAPGSPLLFPHYGPVGINVAFALVLFIFPVWLKKLYQSTYLKSFGAVLMICIPHYLLTYQFLPYFCWEKVFNISFNQHIIQPMNICTISYILLTILVYPFFMRDYPKNEKEFRQVALTYFILWGIVFFLLTTSSVIPPEAGYIGFPPSSFYNF